MNHGKILPPVMDLRLNPVQTVQDWIDRQCRFGVYFTPYPYGRKFDFLNYPRTVGEVMPIAAYIRVSIAEQSLDRQLEATYEYATKEIGVGLSFIEVYRDKSTGTDVERSGYQRLLDDADAGRVDAVVVHEVSL